MKIEDTNILYSNLCYPYITYYMCDSPAINNLVISIRSIYRMTQAPLTIISLVGYLPAGICSNNASPDFLLLNRSREPKISIKALLVLMCPCSAEEARLSINQKVGCSIPSKGWKYIPHRKLSTFVSTDRL